MFIPGMFHIVKDVGKWVFENGHRFIETDAMLAKVAGGFLRIPREFHGWSISQFYLLGNMMEVGFGRVSPFGDDATSSTTCSTQVFGVGEGVHFDRLSAAGFCDIK
jgi:hypothetical protein